MTLTKRKEYSWQNSIHMKHLELDEVVKQKDSLSWISETESESDADSTWGHYICEDDDTVDFANDEDRKYNESENKRPMPTQPILIPTQQVSSMRTYTTEEDVAIAESLTKHLLLSSSFHHDTSIIDDTIHQEIFTMDL